MFQESLPAVEPSTPVPLIAPDLNVAETTMESLAGFPKDLNSKTDPLGNVGTKWMKQRAVQWDADYKVHFSTKEASLCYLLTVRIIRMRNLPQGDFLSQSDCYVSLWLPTASAEKVRTKTIKNCRDPVWNETFYFRIQSQVKNVLELTIFDEDIVQDDGHFIVLFDIAKIPLGETIFMTFQLNPQRREELEAEFTLENLLDLPETIITNGVVVSREISCLEVQVDRRRWKKKKKTHSTKHDFTFTVKGSFEETRSLSLCCDPSFHLTDPILFHYAKHSQPQLDITVPKMKTLSSFCACMSCRAGRSRNGPLTVPLNLLPFDQEVIDKHRKFDLHFKTKQCREDLDVRLGFELCVEEQDFLHKRKKVVAAALKKVLQLEEDLQDDEVPVVAFMTTGGGTRALTAMYAHLLSIQKLNVLDCISYITGLSGTTWTMSNLYEDPDWSQKDMEASVSDARKHVIKNKFLACFSVDRLKYYVKELHQRKQEGHKICFTDLWGLIIEAMLHDGEDQHKLTDQQQALSHGQNPLPIYLVLNVKDKISNRDFREWMEFTPYEVGLLKYGAFIRAENFGSEFFMGRLMKKLPESRICFLEGIWSSVFSLNLMDAWYISFESEEFWHKWTQDRVIDIEEEPVLPTRPSELTTRVVSPPESLSTVFRDVLMLRPAVSEIHNFLKGCQMHNNYLENEFSRWKDCELDCHPNQLTGAADHLTLVDTAFAFETSYPPLMRPERKVDLILHFNYSSGSQIAPLIKASKYFSEQGIPFPKIVPGEEEAKSPKECYIVGDKEGPETPVVLLFPLVNDTFRNYKAPGVKRSPSEMAEGEIDVADVNGSYNINNLRYSEEDFDKLAKLSYYNVQNNKDLILQALRIAVERKKQHRNSLKPHTPL
ncbi:cytosolic phospholipase A2 epsilon-like [Trachemys scripta elegans]|uniref:cytosolic phospholipase A2 epsilon-like n=1 Tax=Trachemys scripta elegans TaxID=31138 RepID=UPI00155710BE|nr:cytosolic phospholipase A2 epsilon-like [Trachemys scripta elegans]